MSFLQVQDLWRVVDKGYDRFCDDFECYLRKLRRRGNHRRRQRVPVDVSEWTEVNRRKAFTEQEQLWMKMSAAVTDYERVLYAGHLFRTQDSEIEVKTCNSILRIDYQEHDGQTVAAYGVIHRLFSHQMYPAGPLRMVAEKGPANMLSKAQLFGT